MCGVMYISYIPWCIASYYIFKLPNARDPISSTGTRLRAVSLFSVVRGAKRETRKWPRAWLMARDGRSTKKERLPAKPERWDLLMLLFPALYLMFLFLEDVTFLQCFSHHQLVNGFDCWQLVVNASQISQSYFALWGQRLIHWLWLSGQSQQAVF